MIYVCIKTALPVTGPTHAKGQPKLHETFSAKPHLHPHVPTTSSSTLRKTPVRVLARCHLLKADTPPGDRAVLFFLPRLKKRHSVKACPRTSCRKQVVFLEFREGVEALNGKGRGGPVCGDILYHLVWDATQADD